MVILVRNHSLPRPRGGFAVECKGPIPEGRFFGLVGVCTADVAAGTIRVPLTDLISEGCRVWLGNTPRGGCFSSSEVYWEEIWDEKDVPNFKYIWKDPCQDNSVELEGLDGWWEPFQPQFYVVPPTWRPEWDGFPAGSTKKEVKIEIFCPECGSLLSTIYPDVLTPGEISRQKDYCHDCLMDVVTVATFKDGVVAVVSKQG